MQADLLIIGAGAAGLMAAMTASSRGLSVIIIEAGKSPGRKLEASGGGRANFGNRYMSEDHYIYDSGPAYCRNALAAFSNETIPELLFKWHIPWEERKFGRRFLTVPAKKLLEGFVKECRAKGVQFFLGHKVQEVEKNLEGYRVLANGKRFSAENLLLALGSPAAPLLGGTTDGYTLAKKLGHHINPPAPALSPLLWQVEELKKYANLAGIGLPGVVSVVDMQAKREIIKFADDILFTHKGLSGPAALNASLYWRKDLFLSLDFLPGKNFEHELDQGEKANKTPRSLLKEFLPQKLVDTLLPENLSRKRIAQISRRDRIYLANCVQQLTFKPKGLGGMQTAEICRGGVTTRQINPQTFASLIQPNLYIVGEMLDVAGELGGYNLHWAFASGYCAGISLKSIFK